MAVRYLCHCIVRSAQFGENDTKGIVRIDVLRVQLDGLAVFFHRVCKHVLVVKHKP